jgi:hypothetical protein
MNLERQIQEIKKLREELAKSNIKVEKMPQGLIVVKPADAQAVQRQNRQAELAKREAREKKFSRPLTHKIDLKDFKVGE